MLNLASLNQRVNALTAKVNNIVPGGTQDLATTLANGNSAGANDIDMNSNDITNVSLINGSVYPPAPPATPALSAVLTAGDNAGGLNITNLNDLGVTTINGGVYPPAVPADTLQQVLTAGNITDKEMIFRTDPLVSQLTLNTSTELLVNYENFNAAGGFPSSSKTTYVTDQFMKEQMFINGGGVYNVATLEINGDPTVSISNLKSQVSLLEENAGVGKNVTTTYRPVGITQTNTGATPSDFTVATDSNFLVTSDNVNVNNGSIDLKSATANLTVTTGSILYTNPSVPTAPFFISSDNDFTVVSDNFDLSNTRLSLINAAAGGALNPQLSLTNTNATGSVALEVYKQKPTAGLAGEPIFTQSCFGKDSINNKQEYTRITHTIRDPTNGSEEGSIEMGCFIGGTYANMIQLNGVDTPAGEVNVLRPIDLSTGSTGLIKVSGTGSTDITLDATPSVGNGKIILKPKEVVGTSTISVPLTTAPADELVIEKSANNTTFYQVGGALANSNAQMRLGTGGLRLVTINPTVAPTFQLDNASFQTAQHQFVGTNYNLSLPSSGEINFINANLDMNSGSILTSAGNITLDASASSGAGSVNLFTKAGVAGSGAGLVLSGNTLLSPTAGGNSGQHLCLTIGGVVYKIALLNA